MGVSSISPRTASASSGRRYITLLAATILAAAVLIPTASNAAQATPTGPVVVIVNYQSSADIGAAVPLVSRLAGVMLYASAESLDSSTSEALRWLNPSRVVLLGGPAALSTDVENAVRRFVPHAQVSRLGGRDRTETAAIAALAEPSIAAGRPVVIASGRSPWDIGAAAPLATRLGGSLLYASTDSLGTSTVAALNRLAPSNVILVGNLTVLTQRVDNELRFLLPGVAKERFARRNQVSTAAFAALYGNMSADKSVVIANASSYSSMGIAATVAATLNGTVLLGSVHSLGVPTLGALKWLRPRQVIFVGMNWVSPDVKDELRDILPRTVRRYIIGASRIDVAAVAALHPQGHLINERLGLLNVRDPYKAERNARAIADLAAGIRSGDYGVDADNILRGPAAFEIDLTECPADWSDIEGVGDAVIRIGHTSPRTGVLSERSSISVGLDLYLQWVNENDPIRVDGESIDVKLVVKDDAYDPALTVESVNGLIETENVFSILTYGSPHTLAVYDRINDQCIPHPFVMSRHAAWGDPVHHPWTTGLDMSYATEAVLWGAWIRENMTDLLPVHVAGLVMDNWFGLTYEGAFDQWAHHNPDVVSTFTPVRHDPADPRLMREMQAIVEREPDVFIAMTTSAPCLLAVRHAEALGLRDHIFRKGGALFGSSLCQDVTQLMEPADQSADGWLIVGGGIVDTSDPQFFSSPFVAFVRKNLEDNGLDPDSQLLATGYRHGYAYVEALRIASDLPGGLSRTNFMLAVRSLSIDHPLVIDGITTRFEGVWDAHFIEGSHFLQYSAADTEWHRIRPFLDVNQRTSRCSWDSKRDRCQ